MARHFPGFASALAGVPIEEIWRRIDRRLLNGCLAGERREKCVCALGVTAGFHLVVMFAPSSTK